MPGLEPVSIIAKLDHESQFFIYLEKIMEKNPEKLNNAKL